MQPLSDLWRIVKQGKGRTPVPSGHVSRPSFDDMQEIMKYLLEEPPKSHTEAKRAVSTPDIDTDCFHLISESLGPRP